ncbi:type IV pili methyl-accepting chemotaxis transducer N-terminal domain-containing protein [Pseudothauera rhizosphaerae]|uniref:type IV pili methyl-accepting chemotaxis transducer N-terminal domain-containing protein n=1 Tax=Pseudothauera rhizosphaerae TaxID=2565932 RepID=UPI001E4895AE|nr:type IV pili methyl-accepting chemotaxis transducer N-terminal domain-containing protein [Pseudothauera rhizosphaerae]
MKPVPPPSAWFGQRLSGKIVGILLGFFVVALAAIALTLFISWQLEGAAAAINDAGSLRMRAYHIAYHLARADAEPGDRSAFAALIHTEIRGFEDTLAKLGRGDPTRPLFIPRDDEIPADLGHLVRIWTLDIRPLLERLAATPEPFALRLDMNGFDATVGAFVTGINDVVLKMEHSYARSTNILRTSQVVLIGLAVIGTLALVRFFFVLVIRPVSELTEGVRRMAAEDFSVRVPVFARDELGELSEGFNTMACHVQDLHATLEQRVEDKTRRLTEKNRELEILYTTSGFLHEPNDIDGLCRGFLQRVQDTLGARASSVRLLDRDSQKLCITVCEGLDEHFLDDEAVLACGQCVCGAAVEHNVAFITDVARNPALLPLDTCRRAGFRTVAAATVSANRRPIGVFNLYFDELRPADESERQLLATLGQQLGTAIDNLRLQAREREMAVSEERNLLALELHDSIAQSLAFLNLQAQLLEESIGGGDEAEMRGILAMIRQGVQQSYEDVRELLVHFRTGVGVQQDLDAAVDAALRRLAEQTGIATDLDIQGDGAPLDPQTETQVLYIVQEALSNVRKHADARTATVLLRRGLEGLSVTVRDDGVGFDAERRADDGQAHIGLQIMKERAAGIGARFFVRSSRGKGTEIRLELHRKQEEAA